MSGEGLGAELRSILGEPAHLLARDPISLPLPVVLGLTGAGSTYGLLQQAGIRLGARHVEAWTNGRLKFDIQEFDHQSCDPNATVDLSTLGLTGAGAMITTFIFCFGAQIPAIQKSRTFALDPVGSMGPAYKGAPYCYGLRSLWPYDSQAGLWRVIQRRHPSVKRWTVVSSEFSPDWMSALKRVFEQLAVEIGVSVDFIATQYAGTDYASTVAEMKRRRSDAYFTLLYGTDLATIARELNRQGMLGGPVFATIEFDPIDFAEVGDLLAGWYAGQEYMDLSAPPSPWTGLFLREFGKSGSAMPFHYYIAVAYSAMFTMATLVDRIVGFGGNLGKGDDFVKALEMDPMVPHIYAGAGPRRTQMAIDLATHAAKSMPMVALRATGSKNPGSAEKVATYDVGGRGITLL